MNLQVRVQIIGLGRVGLITAFRVAQNGFHVQAVDIDADLIAKLTQGQDPYQEPGFSEQLLRSQKNLLFSTKLEASDVHILALPSPYISDKKSMDLSATHQVLTDLDVLTKDSAKVVIRSTLPPGTVRRLSEQYPKFQFTYFPEFYREGDFVADDQRSTLHVVGGPRQDTGFLKELMGFESYQMSELTYEEAEILKATNNLYHGLKVAFANEVGRMSEVFGADPLKIMESFCRDEHLNISKKYFMPGFAYGGPCLSKDISMLESLMKEQQRPLFLAKATQESNHAHILWTAQQILKKQPKTLLIVGLAFKSGTDDVRDSAVLRLSKLLSEAGVSLYTLNEKDLFWDPQLKLLKEKSPDWVLWAAGATWSSDLQKYCDSAQGVFHLGMGSLPKQLPIEKVTPLYER